MLKLLGAGAICNFWNLPPKELTQKTIMKYCVCGMVVSLYTLVLPVNHIFTVPVAFLPLINICMAAGSSTSKSNYYQQWYTLLKKYNSLLQTVESSKI